MRHDLNRLGSDEFENLVQALLKKVIGSGTITFGPGKDGGREATFVGPAPYPSELEYWQGTWIFQAKFHDVELGLDKARSAVLSDLDKELDKILNKYRLPCDNYILVTNVPLSGVLETGTRDRVASEVISKYAQKLKNVHVWDGNDVSRLLEIHRDVASSYSHMLTPGDVIAQLLSTMQREASETATTIGMYLDASYGRDQYAQLEQAGEVDDDRLPLRRIFIDLSCDLPPLEAIRKLTLPDECTEYLREQRMSAEESEQDGDFSVLELLLSDKVPRAVLIGGPGEGKSTMGQYIAQIHRATLLRHEDVKGMRSPLLPRVPFRVVLKDYAQVVARGDRPDTAEQEHAPLDDYLARLVEQGSGRTFSVNELHALLAGDPCLLILDGLDEVTERRTRQAVLDRVSEFIARAERLNSNLQVLATSRPSSYTGEFHQAEFVHLRLTRLTRDQVMLYVERWVESKVDDEGKAERLREIMEECLADEQIKVLATTPLQVTILVLIILAGGTPPRQREALFDEYLEIIYKREKAKSRQMIRTEKQVLFGLHQFVGYVLHRRSGEVANLNATLTEDDYELLVAGYLRFQDPYTQRADMDQQIRAIVKDAAERFILIIEPSPGSRGFELRSIQEFFAASHLCDTARDTAERFARFRAIARHPHWRNVTLFFAGRVGRTNGGEAANVIEACRIIDREDLDSQLHRGKWLALELAGDRAFGPNRHLQNSLLEYALGLMELPTQRSQRRLVALLERLPEEDLRDLVVPLVRSRLELLNSRTGLDLVALLAQVMPQSEQLEPLAASALAEATVGQVAAFLRRCRTSLPPRAAGRLAREVQENEELESVLRAWLAGPQPWKSQAMEEAQPPIGVLRRVLTNPDFGPFPERFTSPTAESSSYGTVLTMYELLAGLGNYYTDSFASVALRTQELLRERLGDPEAARLLTGQVNELWPELDKEVQSLITVLGTALYLLVGETSSTADDLSLHAAAEGTGELVRLLRAGWVGMQSPSHGVLIAAALERGTTDADLLNRIAVYAGVPGSRRWQDQWRDFSSKLADELRLDPVLLQSFGIELVAEEADRERLVALTESQFNLPAELVWSAVSQVRALWLRSESVDEATLRALSSAVPAWFDPFDRELSGMKLARLGWLLGRVATGKNSEAVQNLVDVLAAQVGCGGGRYLIHPLAQGVAVLAGGAVEVTQERLNGWLRALGGEAAVCEVPVGAHAEGELTRVLRMVWNDLVPEPTSEAVGAALLVIAVLAAPMGISATPSELREVVGSDVVSRGVLLRQAEHPAQRAAGVVLLLADGDLSDGADRRLVEDLLRVCSPEEVQAWALVLDRLRAGADGDANAAWSAVLLEVLQTGADLPSNVRDLLALQLQEWAAEHPAEIDTEESTLGLPLCYPTGAGFMPS